jgi:transcriptional antiterminator NusG
MPFWVAMIDRRREELAVHCLKLAHYQVYAPRVRDVRDGHHRVVPLFPSYLFLAVAERGWWMARWTPGVTRFVLSGDHPAEVSDHVVADLRAREGRDGLVVLPKRRLNGGGGPQFERGDQVRIKDGPMSGFVGLVAGMRSHERVEVLLAALGRVELSARAVERITSSP